MHPPQFDMSMQVRLPPALAAVHNFIRKHDPHDLDSYENIEDPQPGLCAVEEVAERERVSSRTSRGSQEETD